MEIVEPKDLEQHFSLAKRRHMELCRQKRIFNARNRIIGVRPSGRQGKGPGGKLRGRRGARGGRLYRRVDEHLE